MATAQEQMEAMAARLSRLEMVSQPDVAAASMVEVFKGDDTGLTVQQFFSQLDQAAILGRWKPSLKLSILRLKVKGAAELFLTTKYDFNSVNDQGELTLNYEEIKKACTERFVGRKTDQYYYRQLLNAVQKEGESIEVFAARVRHMGKFTTKTSDDAVENKIFKEEAERRMLAALLNGMTGKPGEVTRYKFPKTWEEAMEVAILAEAEETSRAALVSSESSQVFTVDLECWSCGGRGHVAADCKTGKFRRDGAWGRIERRDNSRWQRRPFVRGGSSRGPQRGQRSLFRGDRRGFREAVNRDRSISPGSGPRGDQASRSYYRSREGASRGGFRGTNAGRSYNREPSKCFRCDRVGHFARECFARMPLATGPGNGEGPASQ